jgi:arylsulfatase A-like enzyme
LYQRFIKEYLRCVASIDDNLGRLLDFLDAVGLSDDTVVIYTSDQGFFLGDHGWFDKRFMYEESLRMPLLVRYPREVAPATASDALVLNVDFAQTLLDLAGAQPAPRMQGRSLRPLLRGQPQDEWRRAVYYRYWEHDDGSHGVRAHYGVRTERYKLIYFYNDGLGQPGASDAVNAPEWELFDLESDPFELASVYDDSAYASVREELTAELHRQQQEIGDRPHPTNGGS